MSFSVWCRKVGWGMLAMSPWHVSPLCVPRLSSPLFSISLQCRSTKDSWLLGEIQTGISGGLPSAFGCFSSLAFPLCVLKHCWNPRRGKCESCNSCNYAFHCWVYQRRETSCIRSHFVWRGLCVSGTPPSTPCFPFSPWCWTKMWSRKLPCCTQNSTKISWRYFINVQNTNSDDCEMYSLFSAGSATVFQDFSHMGPDKYLSRWGRNFHSQRTNMCSW